MDEEKSKRIKTIIKIVIGLLLVALAIYIAVTTDASPINEITR